MDALGGNPLERLLQAQPNVVLDGGLATALEARGFDLNDELWSARILLEEPEAIRQVHLDFLQAGADCITTSTYQASIPGLRRRGLSDDEADEVLRLAVRLAVEARDTFWQDSDNRQHRVRPLVAAGIGPYGAFLADGSEYTGDYGIGERELMDFHRRRWQMLAASGADLLACETIPSQMEARVLLRLLDDTPGIWAWMSFSCRDDRSISDGTGLAGLARECDAHARVAAVGINCTAPHLIAPLIGQVRTATTKPVIVYPNSGERYDSVSKAWKAGRAAIDWSELVLQWRDLGAACIGGCCRVGPAEIAAASRALRA